MNEAHGLGDWVKVIARLTGLAWLAKLYERMPSLSCGCAQSKAALNRWDKRVLSVAQRSHDLEDLMRLLNV